MTLPAPKIDSYHAARGGYCRFLKLSCAKCGHMLASYQKDGPYGLLRRLYHDRIIANDWPAHAHGTMATCPSCTKPIAVAYMYPKENRPCWLPIGYALKKRPHSYMRSLGCFIRGLPRTLKEGV